MTTVSRVSILIWQEMAALSFAGTEVRQRRAALLGHVAVTPCKAVVTLAATLQLGWFCRPASRGAALLKTSGPSSRRA